MKWKFKEWEDSADCLITFEGSSSVDVVVRFTNVPEHDKFGTYVHIQNI